MSIASTLKHARQFLAALVALGLAAGFAAKLAGLGAWSPVIWAAVTVPVLLALLAEIVTSLRRGDLGLDIVAALSMTGALLVGENLAATIVALMYAGGQYLESYAERAARREMTALLSRVPRTAVRHRDGQLEEVALDLIVPGDRLLVRQGDVVPVDGSVVEGVAVLDQSALTGESLPVQLRPGDAVLSGSTNVGDAFDLKTSRLAAESTYAGVVRLVEAAQRSRAPMSRMADRYAIVFLAVTAVLAGAAWLLTGDPIRAVAVLVVATPCPLILAVPVAIVAGLSRAAKLGILIKGGKAIEMLAQVRSLVIDKTGTLTHGQAKIVSIRVSRRHRRPTSCCASPPRSTRPPSTSSRRPSSPRRAARVWRWRSRPTWWRRRARASPAGSTAAVVMVGGAHFIAGKVADCRLRRRSAHDRPPGALAVAIAVDGKLAGLMILSDELRAGTEAMLHELRALGIERIVLATGDRHEVAQAVAAGLSIDLVRSELDARPEDPGGARRSARTAR